MANNTEKEQKWSRNGAEIHVKTPIKQGNPGIPSGGVKRRRFTLRALFAPKQ